MGSRLSLAFATLRGGDFGPYPGSPGPQAEKLSAKRFCALLVFLVPLTVAMAAHMLAPSFSLLYAGVTVSSLAMFVIVVSEEVEQYMSLQREAAP